MLKTAYLLEDKINGAYLKAAIHLSHAKDNFLKDENGDTNIVVMLIFLGIFSVLALTVGSKIKEAIQAKGDEVVGVINQAK